MQEDFAANHVPTLPFKLVRGTTQKAPYFSPAAEGTGLPIADVIVQRHLDSKGQLHMCALAANGFFSEVEHQLVFKKTSGMANSHETKWQIGLYHFKDSAAMSLPVELKSTVSTFGASTYLTFPRTAEHLIAICSLDNILVWNFK